MKPGMLNLLLNSVVSLIIAFALTFGAVGSTPTQAASRLPNPVLVYSDPINSQNVTVNNSTYTVSYDGNNSDNGSLLPTDGNNYNTGDTVNVLFDPLPTKTGYTFAGWSDGSTTYISGGTTSFVMGSNNVTLTAQWALANYTIAYDLGGGSGSLPIDTNIYHIGDTVNVLFTPLPTRTGYTFAGWNDGNTTYTSGGTESFIMGGSNVTLTAQWITNYTVTYIGNGNDGSSLLPIDNNIYHIGETVNVLFDPLPTKTGYTFAGWSDGVTTYTSGGITSFVMGSGDVTLTAQWTAIDYKITYVGNGSDGGNVPMDNNSYHIGDTVIVLGNTGALTKSGYTFNGWSDGTHAYQPNDTFLMGANDITLAAQWLDTTAPNTFIGAVKPTSTTTLKTASFSFTGTDIGLGVTGFQCKLDMNVYVACPASNTKSYFNLTLGVHTFYVRAIDQAGNVDPTPATYTWLVWSERLLNGGFNAASTTPKIPLYWFSSFNFTTLDGRDTNTKYEGTASVKITGQSGMAKKTLFQMFTLSVASGSKLKLSYYVKGLAVPTAGDCMVQVVFSNGAAAPPAQDEVLPTALTKTLYCGTVTNIFQQKTLPITTTTTFNSVQVIVTYSKTSGTVWFDGVSLLK